MVRLKSSLFIMFIWLAVLLSGCVEDKNITETAKMTPAITATASATPLIIPPAEVTPTGNEIPVKLNGARGFVPNITTIKIGDEVVWDNFDQITVTLVSNDGLFDEKLLANYQKHRYVFPKQGSYTFSIKNTTLKGTIIVVSRAVQTPAPSATTPMELPSTALYVTARMKKLSNYSTGDEIKYALDSLKVNVINQINTQLIIKSQILIGDQILEENNFTLDKLGSSVEFTNEKKYFINNTNVNLRLLVKGYQPIEYKFIEVDPLN